MARDESLAESSSATASSSSAVPTSLDTVAQTRFECSVVVRDLERDSLSRKYDHVRCFIAHDDAASVNLYIDQRDGLDYLYHRLTNNIRHVYVSRGRNVTVQLSSKKCLEVVLETEESKRRLHGLLSKVAMRELNHQHFPKVIPKSKVTKVEPSMAYITASDVWSEEVEMKTPPRIRKHVSDTPLVDDHGGKRPKARSMSYRSHPLLVSSPSYDDSPAEWHPPSSPLQEGLELMTPSNSRTLDQAIDQMPSISCSPPFTSKGTLLAKLSACAPHVIRRNSTVYGHGARSAVAYKSKITYADSTSSSRCADAVLQAILGLEVIKQELRHSCWLTILENQDCLFKSIVDVCLQRTKECIPLKTEKVKRHVTKRTTTSNPLNSQDEDAQVFLEELLNQSRQDIRSRVIDDYPFVGKFECDIDHRLVCTACGEERIHTEQNQILSLDLQEKTRASKLKAATIQSLLPRFFCSQEISSYCDACDGEKAIVHRTVSRLPKVLVLHLKRFQRDDRDHLWINDEPVTLEDVLILDQYCQAEALEATQKLDEGSPEYIPATPSDGIPSSGGSRYSSNSPSRSNHGNASTIASRSVSASKPTNANFGIGRNSYPTIHYIPDSDEEDSLLQLKPNTIDLVEDSDEELQYRWAIEDSIRVQSLSQSTISNEEHEGLASGGDETLTDSIYEDIRGLTSNDLSFMTDVQETTPLTTHGSALLRSSPQSHRRSGTSTPTIGPPNMVLSELFGATTSVSLPVPSAPKILKEEEEGPKKNGTSSRDQKEEKDGQKKDVDGKHDNQGSKDDGSDSDDGDEDLKRAILASLQPSSPPLASEKEIKDQEDRDLEEAIRRSLLDQEDNKENISPEEHDARKKSKKCRGSGEVGGKTSGKAGGKSVEEADENGERLSCSQPVGKRDLDFQSNGRRSGNDLKRVQLQRSNTTDVSSVLAGARAQGSSSRSNRSTQFHRHDTASSSHPSQSLPPSLQRMLSDHSEYSLRGLESRAAKKEDAGGAYALASKGLPVSESTKPTITTSKKDERTRRLTMSNNTIDPPASAAPKSADDTIQVISSPYSSSIRTAPASSLRPSLGSGSSSTSPESSKRTRPNTIQQQSDRNSPDGAAIRPPGDEAERAGLYRLRAVVSKPKDSGGGQQAGHYLCDSLGSDGVWRCFDQQSVRRIGSWANMDLQRERIGYLVIYVQERG